MQYRGPQPWKTNRARVLRDQASSAEDLVWHRLRARRFMGRKFVRQASIGPFFGDFVCRDIKLFVEIDGITHCTEVEVLADAARQAEIEVQGFSVFRVTNPDVYSNLDGVLISLAAFIAGRRLQSLTTNLPLTPTLSP